MKSLAEVLEEALQLPLSQREELANKLTFENLGEMQALGYPAEVVA